uniref:Uncharacterized protein n=1 Tax=Anguilla anguilla TaxID=7936 RepID=A0A0E9PGT4_ANGAN
MHLNKSSLRFGVHSWHFSRSTKIILD